MKIQNAKFVVGLLTLGGLLAVAGVSIFLFVPALRDAAHLSHDITQAHAELDAQYANRKNLLSTLAKADQARADMRTLATEFVPAGRELDLITTIENLAAKDGVEERIDLTQNQNGKAAEELRENFDLTLTGSYLNVMQMLVDLERGPTLMLVSGGSVHPSPGPKPSDPSVLTLNLRGSLAAPPGGL